MLQLAAKSLLFCLIFVASILMLERILEAREKNPREAILWPQDLSTFRTALLGDSVFCSYYVDREEETLWRQLEVLTGTPCFPGALDGARHDDFLGASRYLAGQLQPGSVVFIDIIPTRFITSEQIDNTGGNYANAFARLNLTGEAWETRVEHQMNRLYLYRNPDSLKKLFRSMLRPVPPFFGNDLHRNRRWDDPDDQFAANRFKIFRQIVSGKHEIRGFDLLSEIQKIFRPSGITPVFVLTPLNSAEIELLAPAPEAEHIRVLLANLHRQALSVLRENEAEYLDMFDQLQGEDFADLVHTNTSGDRKVATALAAWLENNHSTVSR